MNRLVTAVGQRRGVPHACGDEPSQPGRARTRRVPHACGDEPLGRRRGYTGVFPTHVGMNRDHERHRKPTAVFPTHVGMNRVSGTDLIPVSACSPRMWG